MRFILIRHAESRNNEIHAISQDLYLKERSPDPDLSSTAPELCRKLGTLLKNNNYKIDKFYSSLHLRALKTMQYITETYDNENKIPQEYFPYLHEYGGAHFQGKPMPGLTKKEIKEKFPTIILEGEYSSGIDLEKGWNHLDHVENLTDARERLKKCIFTFKEMASKEENENKTVAFITHGDTLNLLMQWIINNGTIELNYSFYTDNLSLTSFTIDKNKKISVEYINYNLLDFA
ncbi:MAG: phosphoglycerate mutase family protein [archaeon]|nr:phosphoglycerate mutase family protein [archaeon]